MIRRSFLVLNQRCASAGACRWAPCAAIYGRADPAWDRQLQPDRPRSFPTERLFECLRCEQCPRNARQISAFNQWLCPRRADQCGAESAIAGGRSDGSTLGVLCRRRWRRCGLHTVILAVHPEFRPWRRRRASSSAGRWLLEYQRSIGVVEPSHLGRRGRRDNQRYSSGPSGHRRRIVYFGGAAAL